MAGFTFTLEQLDGTPTDPPTFKTAVPTGNELVYRYSTQQRGGYGWRPFGFSTYHCYPF